MKDTISIHIVGISHIDKSTAYIRNSHYIPIRDRPLLTVLWGHAMSALAGFKEVRPTGGLLYQWRDKPQKWWFIMGYVGDILVFYGYNWYNGIQLRYVGYRTGCNTVTWIELAYNQWPFQEPIYWKYLLVPYRRSMSDGGPPSIQP